MENVRDLVSLDPIQFAAVIVLLLPGFVSLKIDKILTPGAPQDPTSLVIEVFFYSLINAAILAIPILWVGQEFSQPEPNYVDIWLFGLLVCIVGPAAWPYIFRRVQQLAADRGLVLGYHKQAWDEFFSRRQSCWLIVHLNDGTLIGGYFGKKSYATTEPNSGTIYLEELWVLDNEGRFDSAIPNSKGALFRASDYVWIEALSNDQVKPEEQAS
jgi:hypothetical protein